MNSATTPSEFFIPDIENLIVEYVGNMDESLVNELELSFKKYEMCYFKQGVVIVCKTHTGGTINTMFFESLDDANRSKTVQNAKTLIQRIII